MSLTWNESYLGKLREVVGPRTLLMPAFRIIIENDKEEILLIKRSDNGMWGLPAGTPELGESLEDCIRREVKEETSLNLLTFECFGIASNPKKETYTYPNGDQLQGYVSLIYSNEWEGVPNVDDQETTKVAFFSKEKFPKIQMEMQHEFDSLLVLAKYLETSQFQFS